MHQALLRVCSRGIIHSAAGVRPDTLEKGTLPYTMAEPRRTHGWQWSGCSLLWTTPALFYTCTRFPRRTQKRSRLSYKSSTESRKDVVQRRLHPPDVVYGCTTVYVGVPILW